METRTELAKQKPPKLGVALMGPWRRGLKRKLLPKSRLLRASPVQRSISRSSSHSSRSRSRSRSCRCRSSTHAGTNNRGSSGSGSSSIQHVETGREEKFTIRYPVVWGEMEVVLLSPSLDSSMRRRASISIHSIRRRTLPLRLLLLLLLLLL